MSNAVGNELRRLRLDFESRASHYPDLSLSVYFVGTDPPPDRRQFRRPNHAVVLWQYVGHYESPQAPNLEPEDATTFGLRGAQVSAFGVIEGTDTALFRRMAYRAGSLVPKAVVNLISSQLMAKWRDVSSNGKLVFATNSDPLAVWLNLILVYAATFHPTRLQRHTLAADPFAASLTVIDHFLEEGGSGAHGDRSGSEQDAPTVPASVNSPRTPAPTSFTEAVLELAWPSSTRAKIVVVCAVGGILIILALWNGLPDSVKERLLWWLP
jgi:hypothetical protein